MSNYTTSEWVLGWLLNWFPMLLLLVVFVVIMRKFFATDGPVQRQLTERKRHYEVLEKILASHEARIQKIEDDKRG
jgi:hypothetical protein